MKQFFLYAFLLMLFATSCTEPYVLQTNTFEDAVVIEATITNELKKQEIKLSRTYRLEENGPEFEEGAVVSVTDNMGNQYEFEEDVDKYVSVIEFQAVPNRTYRLSVTTADGKSYASSNERLTTVTEIQSVIPAAVVKEGVRRVEINVNSFDPANTSKYYRYEYEETYRIEAPKWINTKAVAHYFPGGGTPPGELIFTSPRTEEVRVCFSTKKSDHIIQTNTSSLSQDRVNFPVRFISNANYIIMYRYSILVKQYVQSLAAYTFYQTLKELSGSDNILSQNQPGFFSGNIKSVANPNEKVIGFFEVASYSEKRVFFNYNDLFPGELLPKYPYNCPNITDENKEEYYLKFCFSEDPANKCDGPTILQTISSQQNIYSGQSGEEYLLYPIQCGDCTSFSSNIKPSFWID